MRAELLDDARGMRPARQRGRDPCVEPAPRLVVAFSGGLDSTVLLAALTRLAAAAGFRALHVDHGLHPDSAAWAQHCAAVCRAWNVPFASVRVRVDASRGTGLEAAARDARYAALAAGIAADETLLTAHHADDQLETLLLRALRGAGVRGMRGILPEAEFGGRRVARPLLELTRAEIRSAARHWALEWLEDPSNLQLDYDRNLVRANLVPLIRERWGESAPRAANRLAGAMRDAEAILESVAREDLAAAGASAGRIPLAPLRDLAPERRRNALRFALRDAGVPMPGARRLHALSDSIGAWPDAVAARRVEWRGGEARVHRDRLYLIARPDGAIASERAARPAGPAAPPRPGASAGCVRANAPWRGAEGVVALEPLLALQPKSAAAQGADERRKSAPAGFPESWAREGFDVRFRAGGERFKPAGDAHHRTLKAWFQQRGIVPWMRDRVPLLYRGDRLVAVADLVVDTHACEAVPEEPRWCVRWTGHSRIE